MKYLIFIFLFSLSSLGICQTNKKDLIDQIARVYNHSDSLKLINYFAAHKAEITSEVIVDFAMQNSERADFNLITAAQILARYSKDELTLGWVYYYSGVCLSNLDMCPDSLFGLAISSFKKRDNIFGQGLTLLSQSFWGMNIEKFDDAEKYVLQAIPIFTRLDNSTALGECFKILGEIYERNFQNNDAEYYYVEASKYFIASNNFSKAGRIYGSLAEMKFKSRDFLRTEEYYLKADEVFKLSHDSLNLGYVHSRIGDVYVYTNEFLKAKQHFVSALGLFEKFSNKHEVASVFYKLGDMNCKLGENLEAARNLNEALKLYREMKDTSGIAMVHSNLGSLAYYSGDYSSAIKDLSFAKNLFQSIMQTEGIAVCSQMLGEIALNSGDSFSAESLLLNALEINKKLKNDMGIGNAYRALGDLASHVVKLDISREFYLKALKFSASANDYTGMGNIYFGLGTISLLDENNSEAKNYFLKALPLFQKVKNPTGLGNVYFRLARVCFRERQYSEVNDYASQALLNFKLNGHLLGEANVYTILGDLAFLANNIKLAEEYNLKAIDLYKKINSPYNQSLSFYSLASFFVKANSSKAQYYFEEMMSLISNLRLKAGNAEDKSSLAESVFDHVSTAIAFMIQKKQNDKAFDYLESLKARSFVEQVFEKTNIKNIKNITPEQIKSVDSLQEVISFLHTKLYKSSNPENIKVLQEELDNAKFDFQKLTSEIREKFPNNIEYQLNVTLNDLQQNVISSNEAIIEYFNHDSLYFAFVITKESFNLIQLTNNAPLLIKSINISSMKMREPKNKIAPDLSNTKIADSITYELLIGILKPFLIGKTHLTIIPDVQTSFISFEALISESNTNKKCRYLLEDYTIKYFQSVTLLKLHRKVDTITYPKTFIGFGDPVYDYNKFKLSNVSNSTRSIDTLSLLISTRDSYLRAGGSFERLKYSGDEVNEVLDIFNRVSSSAVQKKIGLEASEENAKSKELKKYSYILFSCHGAVTDDYQSIVLSQVPNSFEDGFLTTSEIMNLDWGARLVVLSACKTGKGKIQNCEGVTGLTRAVMYAGSDAVTVSLWSVDDLGTKELMVRFFRNMIEKNQSPETALRNAKLELLNETEYSDCFYWAPFVLYGE